MDQKGLLQEVISTLRDFRKETSEGISSLAEKVAHLDKQVSLQAKDIEFIKQEDAKQNKLLDEHIEGVRQVREQNLALKENIMLEMQKKNSELEKRIKKLESPWQWVKTTLWLVGVLGALAYALYQIAQLIQILPK